MKKIIFGIYNLICRMDEAVQSVVLFAAAFFLPEKMALAVANLIGNYNWWAGGILERREILSNMKMANIMKQGKEEQAVKGYYRNFSQFSLEMRKLIVKGKGFIGKISPQIELVNVENVFRACANEKGFILTTAHYGNHILPLIKLFQEIPDHYRLTINIIRQKKEWGTFDKIIAKKLSKKNLQLNFLYVGSNLVGVAAYHCLQKGEVVVNLCDLAGGEPEKNSLKISFLGRLGKFPIGTARLAIKFDVPIISYYMKRRLDGKYVLSFSPPILPGASGPDEEKRVTALIIQELESKIKEAPEQWLMWPTMSRSIWEEKDVKG